MMMPGLTKHQKWYRRWDIGIENFIAVCFVSFCFVFVLTGDARFYCGITHAVNAKTKGPVALTGGTDLAGKLSSGKTDRSTMLVKCFLRRL